MHLNGVSSYNIASLIYSVFCNVHHSLDDLVERRRDRAVVAEHEPREQAAVSGYGRAVRDLGDGLVRRFVVQRPADVGLAVAADQQADQRGRPQRQSGQPHGGHAAEGPRKQRGKRAHPVLGKSKKNIPKKNVFLKNNTFRYNRVRRENCEFND